MDLETLRNINRIVERDGKDTTYKFALLRAAIEMIQEQTPQRRFEGSLVHLPVGVLVMKWLSYYYPIITAELPQKKGDRISSNTLAFRALFKQVTDYYDAVGGYAVLEYDMMNGGIPDSIAPVVNSLCMKIRETILKQPMRYIGSSVYGEQYQIFKPVKNTFSRISSEQFNTVSMVQHYGFFTIPRAYYDVFELLGSFITGTHSILLHWAQFTVGTSKNKLKLEQVMQALTDYPPEVRQMQLSRRYFGEYARESGQLHCVWSGRSLASEMHIDHVIPFSISRNNALWNLMPAHKAINIRKSDKIPSAELLDERRDFIIRQWNFMREKEPVLFEREMSFDLITKDKVSSSTWADEAYNALKHRCRYLADVRGLASFTL